MRRVVTEAEKPPGGRWETLSGPRGAERREDAPMHMHTPPQSLCSQRKKHAPPNKDHVCHGVWTAP